MDSSRLELSGVSDKIAVSSERRMYPRSAPWCSKFRDAGLKIGLFVGSRAFHVGIDILRLIHILIQRVLGQGLRQRLDDGSGLVTLLGIVVVDVVSDDLVVLRAIRDSFKKRQRTEVPILQRIGAGAINIFVVFLQRRKGQQGLIHQGANKFRTGSTQFPTSILDAIPAVKRAIARQFLQKHQQIRRLFLMNFPEKILETALHPGRANRPTASGVVEEERTACVAAYPPPGVEAA